MNINSVFKMKSSGRFHTLEPFYADKELPTEFDSRRAIIITEDKKSSYNYFKDCLSIYSDVVRKIEPAYGSAEERESGLSAGRSKIYSSIQYYVSRGRGCIYGAEVCWMSEKKDKLLKWGKSLKNGFVSRINMGCLLYTPKLRNSKSIEVLETSLNAVIDTDSYVNMGYLVLGQNVQSKNEKSTRIGSRKYILYLTWITRTGIEPNYSMLGKCKILYRVLSRLKVKSLPSWYDEHPDIPLN